jgi:hypothetical protein
MNASQLVSDLRHRLSSLLEDPVFAKARDDRVGQRVGDFEDAVVAHNMAMSEEILHIDISLEMALYQTGKSVISEKISPPT